MIGDITQNLVAQFNDNFGMNNKMTYPKGGVNYLDKGNNSEPLVGKVTYGEKISKTYTPAKLLSVSNKQGDYSTGGKTFAAISSVINTYLNKGNQKTSSLYYQRFFFPGKTTLPWQTDNTLAVTKTKSTVRLDMTQNGGNNGNNGY
jgi:hypothetical protein|tara:strand:- start:2767 stop:3204 length:438 start_codon:yes stop_codon:yes gene_type:complete